MSKGVFQILEIIILEKTEFLNERDGVTKNVGI